MFKGCPHSVGEGGKQVRCEIKKIRAAVCPKTVTPVYSVTLQKALMFKLTVTTDILVLPKVIIL